MTDGGCMGHVPLKIAFKADFASLQRRCKALEEANSRLTMQATLDARRIERAEAERDLEGVCTHVVRLQVRLLDTERERDEARAQMEMLAGVLKTAHDLLFAACADWHNRTRVDAWLTEQRVRRALYALSSLPAAGEKWAAMEAVCEAAKRLKECSMVECVPLAGTVRVAIEDDCENSEHPCPLQALGQALAALAKAVQP